MFSELFKGIVQAVADVSKFSVDDIRRCMEKSVQARRHDVTLFLMKISQSPDEDTAMLYEALRSANIDLVEGITTRGPSISFNINKKRILRDVLRHIQRSGNAFGSNSIGAGRKMVVEYSSPNIAKIFHIGHFRTTVLGQFIVNLLRMSGYETVGINYLGDWGKQFGFVLLGYELYGDEEQLKTDPLKHLFDVYVRINADAADNPSVDAQAKEIFRQMEEEKNEKYLALWRTFRTLSIEKYKSLYRRLNISFDVYSGESLYNDKGRALIEASSMLKTDDDGSKVFDLGDDGRVLVIKSDGTTLYMTRDIAAAAERVKEYSPEKIIYVVSCEQSRHFQQLFGVLELLGHDRRIFEHVSYGLVSGMSTRKGKVQFLENILEEAADVMRNEILSNEKKAAGIEDIDATAETLAISTLLVMDFSAKRVKGYEFDIEKRAKNVSGSGPYLQYAHCRLKSIEARNKHIAFDADSVDVDLVHSPDVLELVYKLLWFEHVVELCLEDYEPSRIVTYLQDLCSCINVAVNNLKVIGASEDLAAARLLVLSSARVVLHNGLRILGITPLNKM